MSGLNQEETNTKPVNEDGSQEQNNNSGTVVISEADGQIVSEITPELSSSDIEAQQFIREGYQKIGIWEDEGYFSVSIELTPDGSQVQASDLSFYLGVNDLNANRSFPVIDENGNSGVADAKTMWDLMEDMDVFKNHIRFKV